MLVGQEGASWDSPPAQHLPVGQGLPRGTQGGWGGCRVLWSPPSWLLHLDTQHRLLQPPPNVAAPRASLLLPRAGRAGPHARRLGGTQVLGATISVPPSFSGGRAQCLQPAQPPAAGGSEKRRGHRRGPQARCGQGTAQLSPVSCARHRYWESWGAERGGVGTGVLQTPAPWMAATLEQRGGRQGARAEEPPANRLHRGAKP